MGKTNTQLTDTVIRITVTPYHLHQFQLAWVVLTARAPTRFARPKRSAKPFLKLGQRVLAHQAFGSPGQVAIDGWTCPMYFLLLFNDAEVDRYLRRCFPDRPRDWLLLSAIRAGARPRPCCPRCARCAVDRCCSPIWT